MVGLLGLETHTPPGALVTSVHRPCLLVSVGQASILHGEGAWQSPGPSLITI